jgi:hypothetical protein
VDTSCRCQQHDNHRRDDRVRFSHVVAQLPDSIRNTQPLGRPTSQHRHTYSNSAISSVFPIKVEWVKRLAVSEIDAIPIMPMLRIARLDRDTSPIHPVRSSGKRVSKPVIFAGALAGMASYPEQMILLRDSAAVPFNSVIR